MRSIGSASITFGLVSIPVKLYTAASSESVSFNMLTPDGNRVKQKYTDSVTGADVTYDQCDKGYEVAKDQFVRFSKDEIKALEAESTKTMDIREFVDAASLDLLHVEKSYLLGPDKGGDKGMLLLSDTMKALGKVAVAQWNSRGKEHLVVIRPYKGSLVVHQMYYQNEVRNPEEIELAKIMISDAERNMAAKLVQALSTDTFDASKYEDGFVKRVQDAIERKMAGQPIVAPEAPKATVLDLMAALQASLDKAGDKKPTPKKPKK